MSNGFDAYHKWLSITPSEQPPHHYRLLGLGLFESDSDVIQAAADRQMAHVQTYKNGPQAALSQQLLNEISAAKLCLLKPQRKAAYDEQLRRQLADASAAASPAPVAVQRTASPPPPAVTGTAAASGQSTRPAAGSGAWRSMGLPPSGSPAPALSPAASSTAPNFTAANSPSQNAAMLLAAGRTAPATRPPVAPAAFSPAPANEPERSWSVPPVAAVLAAASVVIVLLVIGIVLVFNHHGPRTSSQDHPGGDATSGGIATTNDPGNVNANGGSTGGNVTGGNITVQQPGATQPNSGQATADKTTVVSGVTPGGFSNTAGPFNGTNPNTGNQNHGSGEPPHHKPPDVPPPTDIAKNPKPPDISVATTLPSKNPPVKGPETDPFATKGPKTNPGKTPGKTSSGKTADGRLALPDAAALTAAETDLATTSPNATVTDLLQRVGQRPPAIEAYVALRKALELSINDGDAITALNIVDQLCHAFAVDELEVRAHALTDLRAKVREPAGCEAMAEAGLTLIDDAIAAENPQVAARIAETTLVAARRSGNNELIRKVTSRILRLRQDQPKTF